MTLHHSVLQMSLALLALTCCLQDIAAAEVDARQLEFFETHVRPILIENCYSCHNSVDKTEAELALDYRDGIRRVINLESPNDSQLLKVIRHEIEDVEMPSGSAKLAPKAISDIARWIRMGAPDPRDTPPTKDQLAQERSWDVTLLRRKQWWCFQPIARPPVPTPNEVDWSDHPVDRFILQQLETMELSPATTADRETLIRRLSFALIGLPPTTAQVAAFKADTSPAAFENLVDRLLESKQFGERWARHWMDWIRYAESHGSEGDPSIPNAYRYRDYLIRGLNADVPYDQLVREHIAGDLLTKPRVNDAMGINESAIGTAHWRMVFHGFAPTDALDEKVRFTDDQINAYSKAFLGLTVSCARCHNHKFDAISHADYYALFGILGSTRPSMLDVNTAERQQLHQARLIELKHEVQQALAHSWLNDIATLREHLPMLGDDWNKAIDGAKQQNDPLHVWWRARSEVKKPDDFDRVWQSISAKWKGDSSAIADHQQKREYVRRWKLDLGDDYKTWFRDGNGLADRPSSAGEFAILADGDQIVQSIHPAGVYTHRLSTKHRGILSSPKIPLDGEYDLWVRTTGGGGAMLRYAVQDYPRNGTVYPVTSLNDGLWKWHRFSLKYWNGDDIHIELTTAADAPLLARGNARSWFGVREAVLVPSGEPGPTNAPESLSSLFALAANDVPVSLDDLGQIYLKTLQHCVIAWRDGEMTDGQALFLDGILQHGLLPNKVQSVPAVKQLLNQYRQLEAEIPEPTRIVGLGEAGGFDQPLLLRGNHKTPSDPVPRRFLEAIDPTPYSTDQSGRLELARDLIREDNPLTSRVIVNRLWHHLFGRGIVATPDNFGRLGDKPSHPQLLDYLATRMVERDWSIKEMTRFLVTSKTWRQESMATAESRRIDPENRLLSHANVRRMEAEAIRDSLLFVAGRLDMRMYGKSVGGREPRRSVYVQVRRNSLDPFLRVFDFPEPFTTTGRRDVTNVPAQSLTMLNDNFVNGLADSWASRILADKKLTNDQQRIELMFAEAFGRPVGAEERKAVLRYLAQRRGTSLVLIRRRDILKSEIATHQNTIEEIVQPVRERLLAALPESPDQRVDLKPIARWEFDDDLKDSVGVAHGVAIGGASLDSGALIVGGQSHVVTAPLAQPLTTKTLEAWVQLTNLDQRGGGAMTVQTPNGIVFDSIVFGELTPRQWLAGSDNHRRSQSFSGPVESTAVTEPVHVVITYLADGRIIGYRNGEPYGKSYKSNGPQKYSVGQTIVSFGVRHLPVSGNRVLTGRILRAQLYDRALTAEEVAASASGMGNFISQASVLAALSDRERSRIDVAEQTIADLTKQLAALGPIPNSTSTQVLWTDLARALFNFKEFIYLK
ncbi:MAG: DUF1553 domain-containing protein [Pirellulaceae bacterium]